MAISGDTALRIIVALAHPGAGAELITQLNTPTFASATVGVSNITTANITTANITTLNISGFEFLSSANALTALAGGGQPGATPITKMMSRFTVVASAGDSAVLPAAAVGLELVVINSTATSMNVFPNTGDAINALSANTAIAVAGTKVMTFFCAVAGIWHSQLGA